MTTMLFTRQMHRQSTRHCKLAVMVEVYLCGQSEETRGSLTPKSFAPVAQPRNLDWLGPGS